MHSFPNIRPLGGQVPVSDLTVSVYRIPTDTPESDSTFKWTHTTLVLAEIEGGGKHGIGYTYGSPAVATFIDKMLKPLLGGADVMNIPETAGLLTAAVRNEGNCGVAAMALSAVDSALWDLKAKVLGLSLSDLLGKVRPEMQLYGSGGFTSYTIDRLQEQLGKWAQAGFRGVKMKVGRRPQEDERRVRAARDAVGGHAALFVDANGAYHAREALEKAEQFAQYGVSWFEEPVPAADLKGLQFIRTRVPPSMRIAAGEYGYNLPYFDAMLQAGAVDVLQADATRCGGITGFLKAGYLCEARQLPFSSHCAPALHLPAALALPSFCVAEYFYDHVRIEKMFFDGVPEPANGMLRPDPGRPGLGLELKRADAGKYAL
ncbi:enolase C-terminal domain-like protein [Compostibacter hankyongensis]|uniref:Enolase C-terminal domain-like protein n=1 Tax=Compostibacter hankyongensis TaxID=1007089 RepID=A0ABP8FYQ0_9BACT